MMRKENTFKKFKWNAVSGVTGVQLEGGQPPERGDIEGFSLISKV